MPASRFVVLQVGSHATGHTPEYFLQTQKSRNAVVTEILRPIAFDVDQSALSLPVSEDNIMVWKQLTASVDKGVSPYH